MTCIKGYNLRNVQCLISTKRQFPITKIRLSHHHLIFMMEMSILLRQHLYHVTAPGLGSKFGKMTSLASTYEKYTLFILLHILYQQQHSWVACLPVSQSKYWCLPTEPLFFILEKANTCTCIWSLNTTVITKSRLTQFRSNKGKWKKNPLQKYESRVNVPKVGREIFQMKCLGFFVDYKL